MRRLLLTIATVVVAVAAVLGLLLFVAGRDKSGVDAGGGGNAGRGPGTLLPDEGDRVLAAGDPAPRYKTDPPASGAHHERPVTRDGATLSDDQLLTALAAGNVVLVYGTPAPPAALRQVPLQVDAAFTPALARAGQTVILARRPGTHGVVALAWRRRLTAASPSDPRVEQFADQWLGAGASGT